MKQTKLVQKIYQASLSHNNKKVEELRKIELRKILDRKAKGKSFTPKWTVAD